jgi:type I restriction enzyme S subunit
MSEGYRKLTIDDVVHEIYDAPHATPEKTEEGPIFLGVSNLVNGRLDLSDTEHVSEEGFQKRTSRVTPHGGDIVFSYETRLGEVALIPENLKCCLGRRMGLLRVDREVADPRYLLYAWLSPEFQRTIHAQASQGSTVNRILLTELGNYPIRVPPLPVQRRIADILGALDDKIELNRRMNETLEEMAQALYRHWFVDFGPFQDQEFKDTEEMGPIPKGWEVKPLESIVTIELDNIDPQDFPDEEFDYYSFSAYDEDRYPKLEVGGEIGSRKSLVKRRKVMVSRLNPGDYRIWTVYPDGDRRGITSTEFIHFVPNDPELWGYLNCHLRSEGFKAEFRRHASGTTGSRQRVRRRTPNGFGTVIPSEDVLETFGKKVNPVWDLIHSNREENQTLAETRDYLLPKLISGKIEVEAAQEIAEDTVEAAS